MIRWVLNLLFRCRHKRLGSPLTPVARHGQPGGETYVVCFDCGQRLSYDMRTMRLGKRIEEESPH